MNIQIYPENLVSRVTFVLLSSIFGQKFSTIPRFFLARRRIPVKELTRFHRLPNTSAKFLNTPGRDREIERREKKGRSIGNPRVSSLASRLLSKSHARG